MLAAIRRLSINQLIIFSVTINSFSLIKHKMIQKHRQQSDLWESGRCWERVWSEIEKYIYDYAKLII